MCLFNEGKELMVRAIDNHTIIKNHPGENNHGINCEILKFLW